MSTKEDVELQIIEKIRSYCDNLHAHLDEIDGIEMRSLPHVVIGRLNRQQLRDWVSQFRVRCHDGPKRNPTYGEMLGVLDGNPTGYNSNWIISKLIDPYHPATEKEQLALLLRDMWSFVDHYESAVTTPIPDEWSLSPEHPRKTTQDGIPFWKHDKPNMAVYKSRFNGSIKLWEVAVLEPFVKGQDMEKSLRDAEKNAQKEAEKIQRETEKYQEEIRKPVVEAEKAKAELLESEQKQMQRENEQKEIARRKYLQKRMGVDG